MKKVSSTVEGISTISVSKPSKEGLKTHVKKYETHDLIFGVVGYAGSGTTHVATALIEKLKQQGKYYGQVIKISDLISNAVKEVLSEEEAKIDFNHEHKKLQRTRELQFLGTELRRKDTRILAAYAIREIHRLREASKSHRISFVIDQLKHPDEVELLREVYGKGFYLIGVACGEESRFKRLKRSKYQGCADKEIRKLMEIDKSEEDNRGQQVCKTFHLSDFFVDNESPAEEDSPLEDKLARFLNIVLKRELIVPPEKDERGMYAAYSAASKSSCKSRQVGAAIFDSAGNLISVGTNEVPKAGGGTYTNDDSDKGWDKRCFKYDDYCRNTRKKEEIYKEVYENLNNAELLKKTATSEDIGKVLRKTRVKEILEFSRSIHAEMDAIINIARTGGASPAEGTIYVNLYPCHICARHIIASGITEVVYIEPYPKSLATDLHEDAITDYTLVKEKDKNAPKKVTFRPFIGVAPSRYTDFFIRTEDVKDKTESFSESTKPITPMLSEGYKRLEESVITCLKENYIIEREK